MEVYFYDSIGAFIGTGIAPKDPLCDGFIIPANATEIKPPNAKPNTIACFSKGKWELIPFYVGQLQISMKDKQISVINYIGEIQEGYQLISSEMAEAVQINPLNYKFINEELVEVADLVDEDEADVDKRIKKTLETLNELDTKRIRAVCEPEIKDTATGETWLEYYNSQANTLRTQLVDLYAEKSTIESALSNSAESENNGEY